jgi:hypothetical protein
LKTLLHSLSGEMAKAEFAIRSNKALRIPRNQNPFHELVVLPKTFINNSVWSKTSKLFVPLSKTPKPSLTNCPLRSIVSP